MESSTLKFVPSRLTFQKDSMSVEKINVRNSSDKEIEFSMICYDKRFKLYGHYKKKVYQQYSRTIRAILDPHETLYFMVEFTPSADVVNESLRIVVQSYEDDQWMEPVNIPVKLVTEKEKPTPLECSICSEAYAEDSANHTPRILKECGHTVCERCARGLMEKSGNQKIKCPQDQKVTNVEKGDIQNLPRNFAVLEVLRDSPNTPFIPCDENSRHKALFFCLSCSADYCEQCYAETHKTKVLSKHQKVPISEKPIQLPKCPTHTYNNAEFLCKSPECGGATVICHTCILGKHKEHIYENLMEKLIENEKKGTDLLENAKLTKSNIGKELKANRDIQETYTGNKLFDKKSREISKYFKSLEEKAIGKLKVHCQDSYDDLERRTAMLDTSLKAVNGFIKEMDGMVKSKKNLHLVGGMEPELNELGLIPVAKVQKKLEDVKITWNNGVDVFFS